MNVNNNQTPEIYIRTKGWGVKITLQTKKKKFTTISTGHILQQHKHV